MWSYIKYKINEENILIFIQAIEDAFVPVIKLIFDGVEVNYN